jgi:hypothetical protein
MALYISEGREDTYTPPGPSGGSDPNPIPTETQVRYASSSGTGGGLTVGDPMSITAGFAWIDDTAPAGGTLRLLSGTYVRTASLVLDNPRNLGTNSAYRVIRSHDLNSPAIIETPQPNLQAAIDIYGGANRLCFYGLVGDGECVNVGIPATADGAQYMFRISEGGGSAAGKSAHHIWIKQCTMHDYYSGGIASLGYNGGIKADASELFLVEDCMFYETAHGGPWGGSACAINHVQQGIADGSVDNMFKPTIQGVQVICGFIFRRNIGYRNYQAREDSPTNAYTDGNFLTTDYWNFEDWGGTPVGTSDYNRGALIENNISFGNGRFYAATVTHPSAGVYVRFNTSVYDGITYRHSEYGVSNEAVHFGGWGGWNDVFRIHANLLVYDPNMAHPLGTGAHAMSKDTSGGGPAPVPLSSAWNLVKQNASASLGPAFSSALNTITTDPGLGAPPAYLTHTGEIARATIKTWATPAANSSAKQLSSPYIPSDGVDCFWRARGAGSLGAALPGGA